MSDNGHNGDITGGLGGSLDLTRGKDREYLRRGIARGWPISEADLEYWYRMLKQAGEAAVMDGNVREMRACVQTAARIVDQIQVEETRDRKDAGLEVEEHHHIVLRVPD